MAKALIRTGDGRAAVRGTAALYAGASAAVLGGLWLDTRRRVAAAEQRQPPVGSFVRADGARLHYVERGGGPAVVLIHGAWMMLQDMTSSPLFREAAGRYRVLAVDRPGYGYSERPGRMGSPWRQARLLRAAIRELGIERPVLVGHSYAGPLSLAYAAQFPDEVAGVVFLGGMSVPTPRLDLAPYMIPAIPLLGGVLRHTLLQPLYRVLMPQVLRLCFAPRPIPPEFSREVPVNMMLRPEQLRAAGEDLAALIPALASLQRHYPGIHTPVAVVAGEEDRVVDARTHALPLKESLPNATLRLVPGVGHMLHHFRPDAVLAAIAEVHERGGVARRGVRP
jgi:pimeloyl-ACP methyl ester carboxylesterase